MAVFGIKRRSRKSTFVPDPTYRGPSERDAMRAVVGWFRRVRHPAAKLLLHG